MRGPESAPLAGFLLLRGHSQPLDVVPPGAGKDRLSLALTGGQLGVAVAGSLPARLVEADHVRVDAARLG